VKGSWESGVARAETCNNDQCEKRDNKRQNSRQQNGSSTAPRSAREVPQDENAMNTWCRVRRRHASNAEDSKYKREANSVQREYA